jgi:hypothetical protein
MRRFGFLMPFHTVFPVGLGVASLWIMTVLFGALRFAHCPEWVPLGSAPANTARITGYYKNVTYLQMQDGTLYCNSKGAWQNCPPPFQAWEQEDAPDWLNKYFEIIPGAKGTIKLETRFATLGDIRYVALLEDGKIMTCATTWTADIRNVLYSREILGLLLLVGIMIFSSGWFLKIFIEEGDPVLSDWFGNIKRIK